MKKDICEKSFKAQMKYANRINARYLLVIGEIELQTGIAKIKNMENGEEIQISLNLDSIIDAIK